MWVDRIGEEEEKSFETSAETNYIFYLVSPLTTTHLDREKILVGVHIARLSDEFLSIFSTLLSKTFFYYDLPPLLFPQRIKPYSTIKMSKRLWVMVAYLSAVYATMTKCHTKGHFSFKIDFQMKMHRGRERRSLAPCFLGKTYMHMDSGHWTINKCNISYVL